MEVKFGSNKHEVLKELKILGRNCYQRMHKTFNELVLEGYITTDKKVTQKGLDKIANIEKDKNWSEKGLVNAVASPTGGYSSYIYKIRAIELGLIYIDNRDVFIITEKGKRWLKERAINVLQKYKLDIWIIVDLMPYVEDISILPGYLTSDYDFIRDPAKKRFDELKGES